MLPTCYSVARIASFREESVIREPLVERLAAAVMAMP